MLARNLQAVIMASGDKPVVLLGHSIGVMITLTYCRLFPESLGTRVRGLVLGQGTYTNPVRTTRFATVYSALQKPVLEPLCHLMIWLSPIVRVLNWASYLNGSAHRSTERDSFSKNETKGQLDFITRLYCEAAPDVVAHGMLSMLKFDATDILSQIPIPTLVVVGDADQTCLPEAGQFMANRIPNAKLFTLKGMKHCGLFEAHAEFDQAAADFVESLKPESGPVAHATASFPTGNHADTAAVKGGREHLKR